MEVERQQFEKARITSERRGDDVGWLVRQPLRKPASKWYGRKRYGDAAEEEASRCKESWDKQDAHGLLETNWNAASVNGVAQYSLSKARKCTTLEAEALLVGRSGVATADLSQRQASRRLCTEKQQDGKDAKLLFQLQWLHG